MRDNSKGFTPILIILVLAAVAVIGYVGYKNYRLIAQPMVSATPLIISINNPPANTGSIADWKTYSSNKLGYTLKAPPGWYSQQNEDDSLLTHQDHLVNLLLSPDSFEGASLNSLAVIFPIIISGPHHDIGVVFEKGLDGLAVSDTTESPSHFSSRQVSYTTVSGKRTLVVRKVWKVNSPAGFAGSWCGACGSKNYYLDLGNGKILEISTFWTKDQTSLENTFDQILSTFKFIK